MPTFTGKFNYSNADGSAAQSGPCRLSFEKATLSLAPASGAPLALDLGDIDVFRPGEYELTLNLYDGRVILLQQFGKTFQNLCRDLLEAYRQRLLRCLLLEDLEEIARFDGVARLESPSRTFDSPAEFRLFESNLAILPTQATGLQWRLSDIDGVTFAPSSWTVTLESDGQRLIITKLAKRTEEFKERLETAMQELSGKSAEIVHGIFPFLNSSQLQQATSLMREGRAVSTAKLRELHPKAEQALGANVVDEKLKRYFDALLEHVPAENYYVGFKLLRKEEDQGVTGQGENAATADQAEFENAAAGEETTTGVESSSQESGGEAAQPILHWFFLPLAAQPGAKVPGNLVAWEATSRSGRATYFFRLVPPEQAALLQDPVKGPAILDAAIRQLNRAIVLLNFRREPIYLPDDSLEMQPRFRRYAIACRKLPELVRLRSLFLGRAIHSSPETWQTQFESHLTEA